MKTPFQISDNFVDDILELSPMAKTTHGIEGSDGDWDDTSPEGHDRLHEVTLRTRAALANRLDEDNAAQRHAARVLHDRLGENVAAFEAGDHLRDVSHIYCPFTEVRDIFDIMDRATREGWEAVVARLNTIAQPLTGYRETLNKGRSLGLMPARRQVESIVEQARNLAGDESAWERFPKEASGVGLDPGPLSDAIVTAKAAVAEFADWLGSDYLADASDEDAAGEERWLRGVDSLVGMELDPHETYEWGWGEVARLRSEMEKVADEIDSQSDLGTVIEMLENDPARMSTSPTEFVAFVQERLDEAVDQLDGVHFDVPTKGREVTVNLAPPGGALGAWYINPSEDWSRPGSVWYSLGDQKMVPLWEQVSTAYHEGFPGHHLQVATVLDQAEHLSRAHRLLIWYSGYGEGWALYTERLMEELGFLDRPEYRLGMLANNLFRSVRVVVDTGLHNGFRIPDTAPLHAGEEWSFETAVRYLHEVGLQNHPLAVSEVKRYLGWPAQAITYKVGEREILDIREDLRKQDGFDLKQFNTDVLVGGEVRLDYLRERML